MALELGAAAGTAALLSGVVTAFGCAGRLAFGRLFDMLGGHRSALWDSLIMAVAMALMVISFLLDRLPLLLLGLGLLGIGYGGMSSLCAALVRDLFGPRPLSSKPRHYVPPDGSRLPPGPHVGQLSLYPMGQLWRCVPSSAPVKSHRSVPHLPQSALQRLAAAHCFYLQLGRFSSLLRLFLCT